MLAGGLLLAGCGPGEPLRIGFLGGLSGRVADLGIDGRNGALLAVEMRNAAGGVNGRPVELLAEDDEQDVAVARRAFDALAAKQVEAIVGPMTSSIAIVLAPLADQARTVLVSPTATTNELTGRDDHFFRVVSPTREFAKRSAEFHYRQRGMKRVVVVHDVRNRAYSESWLQDYRDAFTALGGQLVMAVGIESGDQLRFSDLAGQVLAPKPDGVLMIANSVDAAMLCQQLRKLDARVALAASEWAATERLIELGGRAVEGIAIGQFLDRQSTAPSFLEFRRRYVERFGSQPGYAGLTAFDAANVVLDGLARRVDGQPLKQVLANNRTFTGAQGPVRFDVHGDASRETIMTTVRDGRFVVVN